jgi:hypothetical protein
LLHQYQLLCTEDTEISIVIAWEGGEILVIETNVSVAAYDVLLGLEVTVKEVLLALPGKGSPVSPRPAVLVLS